MTKALAVVSDSCGEKPLLIDCNGETLTAVLHTPVTSVKQAVLLIVGGPQYRVGSHRQFVLLARELSKAGIACFRFDYRGMGDSSGNWRDFSAISDDIAAAMNVLHFELPSLQKTALWGLCDAASAALLYAPQDSRVSRLILVNPWVRSPAGLAKTYLKNYYLQRLASPELWRKIVRGKFDVSGSVVSLLELLGLRKSAEQAAGASTTTLADSQPPKSVISSAPAAMDPEFLPKMLKGWQRFSGDVLLLLSGNDYVAGEFRELVKSDKVLKKCVAQATVTQRDFPQCDHTFSSAESRRQVADACIDWLLTDSR